MVFVNYIYDMVIDTQFHKFHGRPFARVLYQVCIPHEIYRSVTHLGATRVKRTIKWTMLSITILRTDTTYYQGRS